jgi:hypothetical protein
MGEYLKFDSDSNICPGSYGYIVSCALRVNRDEIITNNKNNFFIFMYLIRNILGEWIHRHIYWWKA